MKLYLYLKDEVQNCFIVNHAGLKVKVDFEDRY